jgi:hypothetical protein
MTNTEQVILLVAVGLIAIGSFITGFEIGKLPKRESLNGRHAKGRGRHSK